MLRPRSLSPLVLTCEHASGLLPQGLRADRPSRGLLATHWGHDIGAWTVADAVATLLDATAIGGTVTRLVVDLNRAAGDDSLVVPRAGGVDVSWNAGIAPEEIERRFEAYHVPYHAAIDAQVARRLIRGVRPFLLAIHSFTPELDGKARPFDAGVLFMEEPGLARRLAARLRKEGLTVRYNEPYSGLEGLMYAIQRHGSHHRLPCLELELNQRVLDTLARCHEVGEAVARAAAPLAAGVVEAGRP